MPTTPNGAATRAEFAAKQAALLERLNSAPVTVTRDGRHIGWHVPLKSSIYRTRELAREFCTVEPEPCATFFARRDSIIRTPLTYRQYAALVATPVRGEAA